MRVGAFASYHPAVNFAFFAAVLAFGMTLNHPACLIISAVCAFAYALRLNGAKAARFALVFMLPAMILAAAINPLVNHRGATILTYLPDGNPLTLESVAYGGASALALAGITAWFACFGAVMTSDKTFHLLRGAAPSIALALTAALRFVPRYIRQAGAIAAARRGIGIRGGRVRSGIRVVSIMTVWALENAVETADSMRSRGFGLPGRTSFGIFRFTRRDAAALAFIAVCAAAVIAAAPGGLRFRYFPTLRAGGGAVAVLGGAAYLALCALPLILEIMGDLMWKARSSGSKT
ncbi:MAG: energy-coupling factor transporter transmembrane protein EcfT [Clostridiales bacterium]|jgi:energy-coupling factor transport system permease protein|nr:energy-coupling factor transporter transmembrane protein EcfT [Clostridiales bacterium]